MEMVDVIVHIPLEEELNALLEVFPYIRNVTEGVYLAYFVKAPSHLKVLVIKQEEMGRSAASAACRHVLERYSPKLDVCLGIAGSLSSDLNLGDVCYTGNLIDVYDNSKVIDVDDGAGVDIAFSPEFYSGCRKVTAALGFIRTMPELSDLREYCEQAHHAFLQKHLPDGVQNLDGSPRPLDKPKSKDGFIICGAVSQSTKYKS